MIYKRSSEGCDGYADVVRVVMVYTDVVRVVMVIYADVVRVVMVMQM